MLVLANPGPPGKWPLKQREKESLCILCKHYLCCHTVLAWVWNLCCWWLWQRDAGVKAGAVFLFTSKYDAGRTSRCIHAACQQPAGAARRRSSDVGPRMFTTHVHQRCRRRAAPGLPSAHFMVVRFQCQESRADFLHCVLAPAQCIVIGPVCLWVGVCVGGSVTTITRNCVHQSSPIWVYR